MKYTISKRHIIGVSLINLVFFLIVTIFFVPQGSFKKYVIFAMCLASMALITLVVLYERNIHQQLIQLSRALDAQINEKPIQTFSEIEDVLLSKIQSQLITLDHIWTNRFYQEKQEKERLNGLISDISHQLKTPLSNLKLYDELLISPSISKGESQAYINKRKQQLEKLEWLMEVLVKVSRMETGLIQLTHKDESIKGIVLAVINQLLAGAEKKSIEIKMNVEEDSLLKCDRKWLIEAIFNVLDNSIKYGPYASVVTITVRNMELFLRIDIEDEGQGIPTAEYNNIFKRFYRMQRNSEVEGVGIGLYMTRDIVTRHDGHIVVESKNHGNLFSIFLPNTNR